MINDRSNITYDPRSDMTSNLIISPTFQNLCSTVPNTSLNNKLCK